MTYKEQCRGQICNFFIITEVPDHLPIQNLSRVHPLKQKLIIQIFEELQNKKLLNKIESMILFGSSITQACNMKSDLDMALQLLPDENTRENKNPVYKIIGECADWNCNIFFLDKIGHKGRFYENVMNGVTLYNGQSGN